MLRKLFVQYALNDKDMTMNEIYQLFFSRYHDLTIPVPNILPSDVDIKKYVT